MFHWICPECGREIPPELAQCPACDPLVTAPVTLAEAAPPLAPALEIKPPALPEANPEPVWYLPGLEHPAPEEIDTSLTGLPAALALLAPPEDEAPATAPLLPGCVAVPSPAPPANHAAQRGTPVPVAASTGAVPQRPPADRGAIAPGPRLALASLADYSAAATRIIQPAAPRREILAPDSGPRVTLPGPALPPQLNSFQAAGIAAIVTGRPQPAASPSRMAWIIRLAVVTILLTAGVAYFALPRTGPDPHPSATVEADAAPAPPSTSSYPLSKSVEVTGFRFVTDAAKKSALQYLVVNHSSAGMSDMTVYVTLRSVSAQPGQPPLARFSFRSPALGPYEAKPMSTPIDRMPRTGAPDWQDLRAEVELGQ